jgi:hypothetical protein
MTMHSTALSAKTARRAFLGFVLLLLAALLAWPAQAMEQSFPAHYPESFDARGVINRISSEDVVIGDTEYEFALGVSFNTPQMSEASRYNFEKGSSVGFILNDEHEIDSLWLIDESMDSQIR